MVENRKDKRANGPISMDGQQEQSKPDDSQQYSLELSKGGAKDDRIARLELSDPRMRQAVKYMIANKFIMAGLSKAHVDVTSERSMMMLSESFMRRGDYEKAEKYGAQCLKRLEEKGDAYRAALRPLEELQLFLTMVKNAELIGSDTENVRKVLKECESAIESENLEEYFKKIDKAEKEMKKELKRSIPVFKNVLRNQLEEARVRGLGFKVRDDIFKELEVAFAKEEYMIALVHALNCVEHVNTARDDYAKGIVDEALKKLEAAKSAGENVVDAERAFKHASEWLAEVEKKRVKKIPIDDGSGKWNVEELSLLETAAVTSETITSESIGIILVSQKGVKCSVCQGSIKPRFPVTKCDCGKTFHDTCGMRVESCPYCGASVATPQNKKIETVMNSARITIKILDTNRRKMKGDEAYFAEMAIEEAEKELASVQRKYEALTDNEVKLDIKNDAQFIAFGPTAGVQANVASPSLIGSLLADARNALAANDLEKARHFAENAKRLVANMYPSVFKLAAMYWEKRGHALGLPQVDLAVLHSTVVQAMGSADEKNLTRAEECISVAMALLLNFRLQTISNTLAMYQMRLLKLEKLGANVSDAKELLGLAKTALVTKNVKGAEETVKSLETMVSDSLAAAASEKLDRVNDAVEAARSLGIELGFESDELGKIESIIERKHHLKAIEGLNALEDSLNRKLQWNVPQCINAIRSKVASIKEGAGDTSGVIDELSEAKRACDRQMFVDAIQHARNASILIDDVNFDISKAKEDEQEAMVADRLELAKQLSIEVKFKADRANLHKLNSLIVKGLSKAMLERKEAIADADNFGASTTDAKKLVRDMKALVSKDDYRGAYDMLSTIDSALENARRIRVVEMLAEVEAKLAMSGDMSLVNAAKEALEEGEIGVAMMKLKDASEAIERKGSELSASLSTSEDLLLSIASTGINVVQKNAELSSARHAFEGGDLVTASRLVIGIVAWCEQVISAHIESASEKVAGARSRGDDVRWLAQLLQDARDALAQKDLLRALQFAIQVSIEIDTPKRR